MTLIRRLAMALALACGLIGGAAHAQLTEVTGFGSNPGNLRMFRYVPAGLPANAGLVVMMHGCAQTPADVDVESGWTQLADAYKFALVFPQTTFVDPAGQIPCFRSYDAAHNRRGVGETLSIKQMTDWMRARYPIAAGRVFAAGFSSGAIHTPVMLAAYPDVFAAGAILSGHPYGCATNYTEFVGCNVFGRTLTAQQWGDLARGAYRGYRGAYPRVSIWHGTLDIAIRESQAAELVKQWTNLNAIDQTADEVTVLNGYPHYVYKTAAGEPRVEHYQLTFAGHAIQVNTLGLYTPTCGSIGGLATQASSICQVFYVARWFGLVP
ncbi:MAG: PHB depolymerase family esterase [Novosphingobium sp.]